MTNRNEPFRRRRRRKARPRNNHRLGREVVVSLVLSTVATLPHRTVSHTSYSVLYENFVGSYDGIPLHNKDAVIQTRDFGECFKCVRRDSSCYWGACQIPIPPAVYWAEWCWAALLYFASTLEVLVRGFTLGFGLRMLKYLFWEEPVAEEEKAHTNAGSVLKPYRAKVLVAAVSGLSLALFFHGSSIFFPVGLRESWFSYDDKQAEWHGQGRHFLPPAVYRFLHRTLTERFQNRYLFGTEYYYDCPLMCKDDPDQDPLLDIDWNEYGLGRLGSGLMHLVTTLEVLLRGFSLGFGARMIKFLFFPNQTERTDNSRCTRRGGVEESSFRVPDENDDDNNNNERERGARQENTDDLLRSFRHRAIISVISGVSVAAVVHGSSLFVPTDVREQWFDL